MNRLAMIAATGFLAVLLTACGESGSSKPADSTDNNATQQTQPQGDAGSDAKPADGQSQ